MSEDQVKVAVDAMASAFEEFKSVNDARLAEIEAKGSADPITEEKLAKIEGDLDRFEGVNQKLQMAEAKSEQMAEQLANNVEASCEPHDHRRDRQQDSDLGQVDAQRRRRP